MRELIIRRDERTGLWELEVVEGDGRGGVNHLVGTDCDAAEVPEIVARWMTEYFL